MDPRVRQLYKKLLYIGRDYPQGYLFFRERLHKGFLKQAGLNHDQIENAIEKGEFIYKEIESLIFLTKYREMKRRYYSDE